MKTCFLGLFFSTFWLALAPLLPAQTDAVVERKFSLALANRVVECSLLEKPAGAASPLVVAVHSNETTAQAQGKDFVARNGGRFVAIHAAGQRRLHYAPGKSNVTIDPNRIFSLAGIRADLKSFAIPKGGEDVEINKFAQSFMTLCQIDRAGLVIAVHNNTDGGNLSISSYKKGGAYTSSAKEVSINPTLDADDFFLVTTAPLFEFLKARKLNVVLQDNETSPDDGSLSVYCGRKEIPYVNVETEAGEAEMQKTMLQAIGDFLAGRPLLVAAAVAPEETPASTKPAAQQTESGVVKGRLSMTEPPATATAIADAAGQPPAKGGAATPMVVATPVDKPAIARPPSGTQATPGAAVPSRMPAGLLKTQGIDYETLLGLARRGEPLAVTRLSLLPSTTVLDGAAAVAYNQDLEAVLAAVGDQAFAQALVHLSGYQRASVLECLKGTLTPRYPQTSEALGLSKVP